MEINEENCKSFGNGIKVMNYNVDYDSRNKTKKQTK